VGISAQDMPKMPMGMNTGWNKCWTMENPFIDLMKTSSSWITYHEGGGWSSKVVDSLEVDENGYPLELPQTINGNITRVRFRLPEYRLGRFVFLYDGEGDFSYHGHMSHEEVGGKHYITLSDPGTMKYIHIERSVRGNHVRNIRILPVDMEDTYDPAHPFREVYLDFLRPFQVIRVRGLMGIDDGYNTIHWDERPTPSYYTQDTWHKGVCIEHCIQLCNELNADMWFSVPHPVWDDWLINAAKLVRDSLKPCLKVYLEFSNELWNWGGGFPQSHWVGNNGRASNHPEWDAHDSVYNDLRAIGQRYCDDPDNYCHPEKDAYMMARLFNIWRPVFEEAGQRDRLICVAGIQKFWIATTNRILKYLFNDDGGGCDAIGPASYFKVGSAEAFDEMDTGSVTVRMIYDSAVAALDRTFSGPGSDAWELDSLAAAFGVKVACYEGGSHMYDYNEHHWSDSLTALHGDPLIYDLYRRSYGYWRDTLKCIANTMLSTIGEDYSKFAHITDWNQIYLSREQMMEQAPKYLAATDACMPKRECTVRAVRHSSVNSRALRGSCRIAGRGVSVGVPVDGMLTVRLCTTQGRQVALLHRGRVRAGTETRVHMPVDRLAPGVYLVSVGHESVRSTLRVSLAK